MTREERVPPQAVGHLAAEVVRAASAAAEAMSRTADGPPAVGDVYVFDAAAEHDVEWLLAAVDPARPGAFRAVAADTAPWVGGGDVELPEDEAVGPLVARCHHWLWLGQQDLAAGSVTGRVGEEAAARVEERCRLAEEGRLDPSPLERETDADPDYQDRHRELADAVAKLAGREAPSVFTAPQAGGASAGEREPRGPRHETTGRKPMWVVGPRRNGRWVAAAAAVLLIALLAWVGSVLSRQDRQIAELRRQVDEASRPVVAVSEPFPIDVITRGADVLEPTAAGGQLHLQLGWKKPPLDRYRAVITEVGGDEALLTFGEFTVKKDDVIAQASLSWGRDLLAPGAYELKLFDPTRDPPRLLRAVPLRIPAPGGTAGDPGGTGED